MGWWNTVMSDTVGTIYRAGTGKVDPWTKAEIVQNATDQCVKAGGDPTTCQQQQQQTVDDTIASSNVSWWEAFNQSFGTDNGTGCGFTNIGGCLPFDAALLPYMIVGVAAVGVLWFLRPFFVAVEE
jgi:hypothetical protein